MAGRSAKLADFGLHKRVRRGPGGLQAFNAALDASVYGGSSALDGSFYGANMYGSVHGLAGQSQLGGLLGLAAAQGDGKDSLVPAISEQQAQQAQQVANSTNAALLTQLQGEGMEGSVHRKASALAAIDRSKLQSASTASLTALLASQTAMARSASMGNLDHISRGSSQGSSEIEAAAEEGQQLQRADSPAGSSGSGSGGSLPAVASTVSCSNSSSRAERPGSVPVQRGGSSSSSALQRMREAVEGPSQALEVQQGVAGAQQQGPSELELAPGHLPLANELLAGLCQATDSIKFIEATQKVRRSRCCWLHWARRAAGLALTHEIA